VSGDQEAVREMEAVITAHESALLRYAGGLLRDAHAAQDVVQNAFIKLFRQWGPGMTPTPMLKAWLFRVVHNEAVDHMRREKRRGLLHERHAMENDNQTNRAHDPSDQIERILEAVRRLDADEQQVVLLRIQEGLSYREISQITGRSEGNVGCILHHAVKKLGQWVKRGADGAKPVGILAGGGQS
jgi:RNA polymerase sigma factor (sigma-70 family)